MSKFDLKFFTVLFGVSIVGAIVNSILFKSVFFGDVNGIIISIGAMTFFLLSMGLTAWFFRFSLITDLLKKKVRTGTEEEILEQEKKSKYNYLAIFCPIAMGVLYGFIFAIFYSEIGLFSGVFTMATYGLAFGLFMFFLVKKGWFSFFQLEVS